MFDWWGPAAEGRALTGISAVDCRRHHQGLSCCLSPLRNSSGRNAKPFSIVKKRFHRCFQAPTVVRTLKSQSKTLWWMKNGFEMWLLNVTTLLCKSLRHVRCLHVNIALNMYLLCSVFVQQYKKYNLRTSLFSLFISLFLKACLQVC